MTSKRKIEVFSAGCPVCEETIELVESIACPSCELSVLDMNDPTVAQRAHALDVRSVPAVTINAELASCCEGKGPDKNTLIAAGIGEPLP